MTWRLYTHLCMPRGGPWSNLILHRCRSSLASPAGETSQNRTILGAISPAASCVEPRPSRSRLRSLRRAAHQDPDPGAGPTHPSPTVTPSRPVPPRPTSARPGPSRSQESDVPGRAAIPSTLGWAPRAPAPRLARAQSPAPPLRDVAWRRRGERCGGGGGRHSSRRACRRARHTGTERPSGAGGGGFRRPRRAGRSLAGQATSSGPLLGRLLVVVPCWAGY
jgi:hypothetical protein